MQLRPSFCFVKNDFIFQKKLYREFLKTGLEGDVVPFMIQQNVPLFILKNLWPQMYSRLEGVNSRITLAVAEDAWRGRIANIKSRLHIKDGGYFLEFQKSHVIDCDVLLVVGLHGEDKVGLVFFENLDGIVFVKRNEESLSLPTSNGGVVSHSRVSGNLLVPAKNVKLIPVSKYSKFARYIPTLEVSSLALLSMVLLERVNIKPSVNIKESIGAIYNNRYDLKKYKRQLLLSRNILRYFFEQKGIHSIKTHPFWDHVQKMVL